MDIVNSTQLNLCYAINFANKKFLLFSVPLATSPCFGNCVECNYWQSKFMIIHNSYKNIRSAQWDSHTHIWKIATDRGNWPQISQDQGYAASGDPIQIVIWYLYMVISRIMYEGWPATAHKPKNVLFGCCDGSISYWCL